MKIVINSCYGGFGLSHEGIMRYAELAGITLYVEGDPRDMLHYYTIPKEERTETNSGYFYIGYDFNRADEHLVQVVEKFGRKSFGPHASLSIVEIPDDVDWQVEEYDGIEHVAEKHRTWC